MKKRTKNDLINSKEQRLLVQMPSLEMDLKMMKFRVMEETL